MSRSSRPAAFYGHRQHANPWAELPWLVVAYDADGDELRVVRRCVTQSEASAMAVKVEELGELEAATWPWARVAHR